MDRICSRPFICNRQQYNPPAVPVLQSAYAPTPAEAAPEATELAPVPRMTEDEYEDKFLQVMQSHWVVPAGVPVDTHAEMIIKISPEGHVYQAFVDEASPYPQLDQSCLAALNQMVRFDPPPSGKTVQFSFGCRVK
jgi:hypothetical protein